MTSKEALEKIKHIKIGNPKGCSILWDEYEKEISTIEKDLDILEIIKNKRVDVSFLSYARSLDEYNAFTYHGDENDVILAQGEFDLIKEWLEDGKSRKIK